MYDTLSAIVFGKALKKAQDEMLKFIPANCQILIIGGGSGRILETIAKLHPSGLTVAYIDSSKKMIEKAKERMSGSNKIIFIDDALENVILNQAFYDVIITQFFFDNFIQTKCDALFQQLNASLKKSGLWLFADFHLNKKSKIWQIILLNLMYLFFKFTASIEATKLPQTEELFIKNNYQKLSEKMFYKSFIISAAFKKENL